MLGQLRPAIISVLVFTIVTGLIFPFVITGIAQVASPHQARGSLIEQNGKVIGSELIGQPFAAPGYFHPRPSAAGNGYNAGKPDDPYTGSSGTNLGPTSDKLINGIHKKTADGKDDPGNFEGIKDLAEAYRKENGLATGVPVPADAVTRSSSGLDPHISPANADLQTARVAKSRGISENAVRKLVSENTDARQFGFLGEAGVNVLKLNMALDKAASGKTGAGQQ
jgi:K+-transporting ATPase ATPase C chain